MSAISDWLEILGDSEALTLSPTETVHLRFDLQGAQGILDEYERLVAVQRELIQSLRELNDTYKGSAERCLAIAREAIDVAKGQAA